LEPGSKSPNDASEEETVEVDVMGVGACDVSSRLASRIARVWDALDSVWVWVWVLPLLWADRQGRHGPSSPCCSGSTSLKSVSSLVAFPPLESGISLDLSPSLEFSSLESSPCGIANNVETANDDGLDTAAPTPAPIPAWSK
jgi:hypothetical protein